MKQGEECKTGGYYVCLFHLKNKMKIKKGLEFPNCNFAGLRCVGEWYLKKEVIEKTKEEIKDAIERRRRAQDKRKWMDKDYRRKLKEPKFNKWDFEKW